MHTNIGRDGLTNESASNRFLLDVIYHSRDGIYKTKALLNVDETLALFRLPIMYEDRMVIQDRSSELVTYKRVPLSNVLFSLQNLVVLLDNGKRYVADFKLVKQAITLLIILAEGSMSWRKELANDNIWFYVPDKECFPILIGYFQFYVFISPTCESEVN